MSTLRSTRVRSKNEEGEAAGKCWFPLETKERAFETTIKATLPPVVKIEASTFIPGSCISGCVECSLPKNRLEEDIAAFLHHP